MTRHIKFIQFAAVAAWLVVLPTTALAAEYNPRPTFTWQKPSTYITFNAITNNPAAGDERQFLSARAFTDTKSSFPLNVSDNEEVVLQVYYDNDAASNYNLKAKNTRVQIALPAKTSNSQTVDAFISADNAKPGAVNSVVSLTADQPFNLAYETGSAKIWNNKLRGTRLSDNIVTQQGALIGYDKIDGVVSGGAQYSGYVTVRAKVHFAKTSASTGSAGVVNGVPNTGPGEVLGLFASASAIGAVGHRLLSARRRI
jgi:hypothetical protein